MPANSQIQKRIEYDHKAMDDAFRDLVSIVSPGEKEAALKDKEDMARGAIEAVLEALGVKVTPVPEEIVDLNARLDYMLRPSGGNAAAGGACGRVVEGDNGPTAGQYKIR